MTKEKERISAKKSIFNNLTLIDLSKKISTRTSGFNKLKYISWADAVAEVLKKYPNDFNYEILENEEGKPFFYDEIVGYWVKTKVKILDQEKVMLLPVLDGANKALKKEAYIYEVKNKTNPSQPIKKNVEAINIVHINKSIMRCLVKNLALFGLGLSLYTKEDIFSDEEITKIIEDYITIKQKEELLKLIEETDSDEEALCRIYSINDIAELPIKQFSIMRDSLIKKQKAQNENI